MSVSKSTTSTIRTPNVRNDFANDLYLKHYFRIAKLHCGPNLPSERAGHRRVDEIGLKATVKLREIFHNAPKPGLIEVLVMLGHRWESGWSTFELRVQALGSTYSEGALLARQAA